MNTITQNTTVVVQKERHSKIVALFLCFFLGGIGVHHFYLNNPGRGVLYLCLFWTGIPLVLSIFDFIIILLSRDL
jgi:TM2 domain-containing membrane protein YozV